MPLHPEAFGYLSPTDEQKDAMRLARAAFAVCAETVEGLMPAGPDATYVVRKLRECAMWANVAITRQADGAPRSEADPSAVPAERPLAPNDSAFLEGLRRYYGPDKVLAPLPPLGRSIAETAFPLAGTNLHDFPANSSAVPVVIESTDQAEGGPEKALDGPWHPNL